MAKETEPCPIIPLQGKCVVERDKAESITKGGIHLPEAAQQESRRGTIVAVGIPKQFDDGREHACQLREGHVVYFGRYSGNEIEIDGRKLLVLDFAEILCVCR